MTSWFLAKVSLSYSEKIKIIQTLPCPSLLEILSLRIRCLGLWGMTDVIPLLVQSSSGTVDILPGFPNPWRFSGFLQDSWSDPECEKNLSSSVLYRPTFCRDPLIQLSDLVLNSSNPALTGSVLSASSLNGYPFSFVNCVSKLTQPLKLSFGFLTASLQFVSVE